MKGLLLSLVVFVLSSQGFAGSDANTYETALGGYNFAAPSAYQVSDIVGPELGSIVFETQTGLFRGYAGNSVWTTLSGSPIIEYVKTVGACGSNPCTMVNPSAGISSVSWNSNGNYTINFVSGTWSVAPVCTITPGINGGTSCDNMVYGGSAPYNATFQCGSSTNTDWSVICVGH